MVVQFEACRVDLDRCQVFHASGETFDLAPREREVLAHLLRAEGKVCTAPEMMEKIWGWKPAHIERALSSGQRLPVTYVIHHLRGKIERDHAKPAHLVTCRGTGWRLERAEYPAMVAPTVPAPPAPAFPEGTWVPREAEERAARRLGPGSPLVVTGPKGIGKTRFLRHVLEGLLEPEDRAVQVQLDSPHRILTREPDRFMYDLAIDIAEQLGLDDEHVSQAWSRIGPGARRLSCLMRDAALPAVSGRLYLIIDPADALTQLGPVPNELFVVLRQWLESARRSPWDRLRVLLAVSTDPVLLTTEFSVSPFNLAPPVRLGDLSPHQARALLSGRALSCSDEELQALMRTIGGSPSLLGLFAEEALGRGLSVASALAEPLAEGSVLALHLEGRLEMLRSNATLGATVRAILEGRDFDPQLADRLVAAGLLSREGKRYGARNGLYEALFRERL